MADSLAIASNTFKVPINIQSTYDVQVKHKPSVPHNIKHWQIFQDDQQIKKFLECVDDFSENIVDQEHEDFKPDGRSKDNGAKNKSHPKGPCAFGKVV